MAKPNIQYGQLQHCGVLVDDVKTAVDFYVNVLGMKDVSELRPPKLDYPGAFLECGKDQIHLMKVCTHLTNEKLHGERGGQNKKAYILCFFASTWKMVFMEGM